MFCLLQSVVPHWHLVGSHSGSLSRRSLELNHVEVVKWHEVAVAAEDVHEALGILDCAVAVARGGLPALDEAEFTLMCVLCGVVTVCVVEATRSLSLLVVRLKALVGVLNDERIAHGNGGRR